METGPGLKNARWRKSSYSGNTGGDCIEVADGCPGAVPVRDSKNPTGPTLLVRAGAWQTFVDGLRQCRGTSTRRDRIGAVQQVRAGA